MEQKKKKNLIKVIIILALLVGFAITILIVSNIEPENETFDMFQIPYLQDTSETYVGWGTLQTDVNIDGGPISLLINGEQQFFEKGYCAHATSQITYDLSEYVDKYTRVTGYFGVDYSKGSNGDGVKLTIYLSEDGITYEKLESSGIQKGDSEAYLINVNLYDAKYIRFVADQNGNNGYDHAVYTDLKLNTVANTTFKKLETISTYDSKLSSRTIEYNYKNYKYDILKREFVSRVGYYTIQNAVKENEEMYETLTWLVGSKKDYENLSLFIEAGSMLNGDSSKTLTALNELYQTYKSDLKGENELIYKKMLIATSVAYCKDIASWVSAYGGDTTPSDPVHKFAAMKNLFDEGYFQDSEAFASYPMELIRYVMDARLQDDEILWLNRYADYKFPDDGSGKFNGYSYVPYINTLAAKSEYYDLANKETYNAKYRWDLGEESLADSYGTTGRVRMWMRMEAGGVCWAISGCGTVVNEVYGIPATNIYQPGHEAYLLYKQNEDGQGIWEIWNNVGGWQGAYSRWGGNTSTEVRLLLGWGNKSYNNWNKNNASYILLAQNALNHYQDYYDSALYNYLANSYEAEDKKLQCYHAALEKLSTNLDSFDGIIELYKNMEVADETWLALAEQLCDAYAYYPLPLYEALNRIKTEVGTDSEAPLNLMLNNALQKASKVTDDEYIQAGACRDVANNLLSNTNLTLATFSFSGENKNQIVINSAYEEYHFVIRYSLDGGVTFKTTEEHIISLSAEELAMLSAEKDIQVGLVGTEDLCVIDVLSGKELSLSKVLLDDEENRLIGNAADLSNLEYSLDGGSSWKDYTSETYFAGAQTVLVRYKSYDQYLLGTSLSYTFTVDSTDQTKSYIKSSDITCIQTSSNQSGFEGKNAIDPNPNVGFHTKYGYTDTEKTIVFEFSTTKWISQMGYEAISANGRIQNAEILTSNDGETWTISCVISNWENTSGIKYAVFDEAVSCRYIKIHVLDTYGNTSGEINKYFSARRIKFYEDLTK